MASSSESWEPQPAPTSWHSRARSRPLHCNNRHRLFDHLVGDGEQRRRHIASCRGTDHLQALRVPR
jgi:hypothetical protein